MSQPAEYSHWDLFDLNRHAAAPLAGDDWYGLQGDFVVQAAGPWLPRRTFHYVPVLWLAAAQPYAAAPAQPGPPATGRRTVGYKATLLVPQNLRLASASAKVRRGRRAVLKGTLAVPADGTPGASVSWAPPGTLVTVQQKAGRVWVPVKIGEDRRERRRGAPPCASAGRPCGARSRRPRRAWPPSTPWSSAPSSLADVQRPQAGQYSSGIAVALGLRGHFVIELRGFAASNGMEPGATRRTQLSLTIYREWRHR